MPNLSTQTFDLTTLYTLIDDACREVFPSQVTGRPPILADSELITILIWNCLTLHQKTLKDVLKSVTDYHLADFPQLPKYSTFLEHVYRVTPKMATLLGLTFVESKLDFADSTFLEVCKKHRAEDHKVAKNIATFGKNHQGWHFGFKLHAVIDPQGFLSSIMFSPADVYDAQMLPRLLKDFMKIVVGDSHYGASVMRNFIWKTKKVLIVAPPHYKQKTKLMTWWQNALLSMRSKIESVFDILKEHLHIVTSFPRSVKGYFAHYIRILLGYQCSLLLKALSLSQ